MLSRFPRIQFVFLLNVVVLSAALCWGQDRTPTQAVAPPAAAPPVPTTAVEIENTNAAFVPTDVNVPQANPARPTVTIPAHLPPTGYLQFEQGFNRANDSPGGLPSQNSLVQTTKIALTTRFLVQFITEPYAYSNLLGVNGKVSPYSAPGDLDLGALGVVHKAVGPLPTVTLGYTRRLYTGAAANLDAGDFSQEALVLLGGDLRGGFHYDSNILFTEQNNGPVRRAQYGQTLAVSHPLFSKATHGKLGSIVELSHFTQPFITATYGGHPVTRANTMDLLFAATYTLRPNLIFDSAFTHGFTSTSTQWQGAFGFTYLLPRRLWADRHPVPIPVGPYHYNTR